MKIIALIKIPYTLPFKTPWLTAKGNLTRRQGFILQLKSNSGFIGLGDCAPIPEMGTETLSQAKQQIDQLIDEIKKNNPNILALLSYLKKLKPAFAMALESAIFDVQSQQQEIPLAQFINPHSTAACYINANIGSLDKQINNRAKLVIEQGYHRIKIKIAVKPPKDEICLLEQLFDEFRNSPIKWRLDANQGWNMTQAKIIIQSLNQISSGNIDYLEEPISNPQLSQLNTLQDMAYFPLAIDESFCQADIRKIMQSGRIKHIVLKAASQGGISQLMNIYHRLQTADIQTTITSMLESSIGIMANLHLACAINNNVCHGLATSHYFKNNLGNTPIIKGNQMFLNSTPGLGATLKENE